LNNIEELKKQIHIYAKKFPNETDPAKCIDLLEKYDDNRIFFRNHFDDGHFTGSVLVVNPEKTKVLLMHHKKFWTWQQFGWHVDGQTNIREEAIRELEEEAGIQEKDINMSENIFNFDIHSVPAIGDEPAHYHYDVEYLAVVDDDLEYIKQEAEVHDIQWFQISEVLKESEGWKYSTGLQKMIIKV
jgi:8-oxo-dGTP pyrophosphatase MutT (NUDIX family)